MFCALITISPIGSSSRKTEAVVTLLKPEFWKAQLCTPALRLGRHNALQSLQPNQIALKNAARLPCHGSTRRVRGNTAHLAPVGNRQLTTPTIDSNHTRCSKVTDEHFRECAVIRANARLSSHNLWASVVGNSEVQIIDWWLNVRHSLCHACRRLPPKACWFALRASGSGQLETSV